MKKTILCLLLTLCGHIVNAGEFEQGMQFFEQKKYAQAKKLWRPLADDGDIRAQYNLALILFNYEKRSEKRSEKNKTAQSQLQKANQYIAMSRANGLVDSYFIKIPIDVLPAVVNSSVKSDKVKSDKMKPLDWLNQQQKNNYTIQLATGKSHSALELTQKKMYDSQLLEQPENLYIQEISRIEKEKKISNYILIYGTFDSYQLAKNEVDKLPESLQKSSPWIRKFGQLQSKVNIKQEQKTIEPIIK